MRHKTFPQKARTVAQNRQKALNMLKKVKVSEEQIANSTEVCRKTLGRMKQCLTKDDNLTQGKFFNFLGRQKSHKHYI